MEWVRLMSYYFSSDGSLKFTTQRVAAKGLPESYKEAKSAYQSSSFSQEMKNNALSNSGKLTSDMKKEAMTNNQNYQRIAFYQKKINEIASRKPRTFDDDSISYKVNTSALTGLNAARVKYQDSRTQTPRYTV